jgi:hypothetical protein
MGPLDEISLRRRSAPFVLSTLRQDVYAATIAPNGKAYVSNDKGVFVADEILPTPAKLGTNMTKFAQICSLEQIHSDENGGHRVQRLFHDPWGGIYFCSRNGGHLYRMPPGETAFHMVYEDLNGTVRGFDYHAPTGQLLTGRYSVRGPARLLASRDGETWSTLCEWDARHIHDVRINPYNGWVYVIVGEADSRPTDDSHAIYRSKNGADFVRLFRARREAPRPLFVPLSFYRHLVVLGSDHPEGRNGIYVFEDDGGGGPVAPRLIFLVPESNPGFVAQPPFVYFLE